MLKNLLVAITGICIAVLSVHANENSPSRKKQTTSGYIVHNPLISAGKNEKVVIKANVDGTLQNVVYMRVYYKAESAQSFDFVEMTKSSDGFFVEIDLSQFSGSELEYFLVALLTDRSVITYPESNPYGDPITVRMTSNENPPRSAEPAPIKPPGPTTPGGVSKAAPETAPDTGESSGTPILILSPEQGEKSNVGDAVVIAASFIQSEQAIDDKSLNIFVDGRNVTLGAEINENLLTYTTTELKPGPHQVLIQGTYKSGAQIPATRWSFIVVGEAQVAKTGRPGIQGKVFAETRQENVSRRNFSDNNIGGNVYGSYGIAKYDARVFLTSRETDRAQPRHRYTFNLELPFLGVTFGDTYPRFNDLILWGKRVRGLYGRLHFGFFNIDVVHGETIRRIGALRGLATVFDPITSEPLKDVTGADSTAIAVTTPGTFRQRLLGVRTSFGSGKHFQWGFNFVNVREDTNSLGRGEGRRTPQDNLVVGTDMLFSFDRRRIEVRGGVATSIYTKDISNGVLDKTKFEETFDVDIPINPDDFADFIIINSSTIPVDPTNLTSLAWNTDVRLNYFNNGLRFGYKSIGAQYISLGNSYLRTDLRGFYFKDRVRLYQNKIFLNVGYDHYRDNFSQNNNNPSTKLRTFYYGMSFYPGRGYPTFNFNLRHHNRDNDIDLFQPTDPVDLRENNNTRDLSAQVTYDVNMLDLTHTLSISYINSDRSDQFGRPMANLGSNVQMFSIRTQHHVPLITTFSFARNDNKFGGGANTFNFTSFGFKAEYLMFNRRLRTYLNTNFTSGSGDNISSSVNNVIDYKRTAFNVGFRFEITPGHFISADGNVVKFNDNGRTLDLTTTPATVLVSNPSFTDRTLRVYYERRL